MEINILPFLPTFTEAYGIYETRRKYKVNKRMAIINTFSSLSRITIPNVNILTQMTPSEFLLTVDPIIEKLDIACNIFIQENVLYINPEKDLWVLELMELHKSYESVCSAYMYNIVIDNEQANFVLQLKDTVDYIYKTFKEKYRKCF